MVTVLVMLGGCTLLQQEERELIFRPTKDAWHGYDNARYDFEERWIEVKSARDSDRPGAAERVHAWWAPGPDANAPVLLYLHGTHWNLTGSAARIPRWQRMGFAVLAIDYRGFGQSDGEVPSEDGVYQDAQAAWDYLKLAYPDNKRFILGHSLGGAVAVDLARRNPDASGLILEATFTSIPDMVKESKWGFIPVGFLITQRFDALDKIRDVKVPILLIHGTLDSIVPAQMSRRLFEAAHAPKKLLIVEGGSHHNLSSMAFDEYRGALRELFGIGQVAGSTATGASGS
jgi:uncharacterized protein